MRLVLAALLLTGCTPAFEGYEEAFEVNRLLNAKRVYRYADMPAGHQPKVMQPGESGNCADFAITKCAMLVKEGFAPDRLSLLKFVRKDGQGHAVCVVDGKWALDWSDHAVPVTRKDLNAFDTPHPYTPAAAWK